MGNLQSSTQDAARATPPPTTVAVDVSDAERLRLQNEQMKRDRLELLKTTTQVVHIISTPFDSEAGRALALQVAQHYERRGTGREFCYNPNEDCPQSLGVSWLDAWMAICDNTVRTGGMVFVVFRSDGKGKYGCKMKGLGSLDGQAQQGEIRYALGKGCIIHWMDQTNPEAAMREMNQLITHSQK